MASNETVDVNELPEYVPARVGQGILGGEKEHGAFFYYVRTHQIRKQPHPTKQRETLYNRDDIVKIKEKRDKRGKASSNTQTLTGATDWVQYDDLPYLQALDYRMYGPENTVPIDITYAWWKKNPYMCRILFNEHDRKDIWGAITVMPMKEETIIKLIRDEMSERKITPNDILTYEDDGKYYGYISSAMVLPEHRRHFRKLIQSVFAFWCEQHPRVQFIKLYAFALSEEGLDLIRHLFFAPRYDLGENAFELDLYRRNPSKLIKSFQECIRRKDQK